MELTTYVETLRADLIRAAEALGPESQAVAERLQVALEPAIRMALMEALSDAAAEITQDLPHAAVEVRLKGREPQFVVTATEPDIPTAGPPQPEPAESEGVEETDGAVARITVRIPEGLKTRAEQAAAEYGQSLNAWIVRAIRRATRPGGINVDVDLGSIPFPPPPPGPPGPPGPWGGRTKRMKGWAR